MLNEMKNKTRDLSNKELGNVLDYEEYKEMLLSLADLKKNNPKGFNEIKNEVLKRKKKKDESLKVSGIMEIVKLEEETKRKLERVCNG